MQIIVDTITNQATVVTIVNGVPVYPAKTLDINLLNAGDKAAVLNALTIIETHSS